jgi:uncharacterized Zn finger protein (UPF0148 family)
MNTPHDPNYCEVCETKLFELRGDWFCPSCDSISGFELVDDGKDSFSL